MANKPISAAMLQEIIRLKLANKSHRKISSILQISRPIVIKYVNKIESLNLSYSKLLDKSESELHHLLSYSANISEQEQRQKDLNIFFRYAEDELKQVGVTRLTLWEEYISKHPNGVQYSRFCYYFTKWLKAKDCYMPIHHKAGDKLYVDHTGKKLKTFNLETGKIEYKEVFVATFGASQYTYVEACESQKVGDYLKVLENALHFFGGVPDCIVPDNLKSAVTKACKYEPEINRHLLSFSKHYNTSIMPARSRKPKDKSLVEGAVKIVYNRIYSQLRNQTFHSLEELNKAIHSKLEDYNNIKFKQRDCSRKDLFESLDYPALKPLPVDRYEIKEYKNSKVQKNSHVFISKDKNYYSVPCKYVGKKVSIIMTENNVEIYYNYSRIAFHKRSRTPYKNITVKEHIPKEHRFVEEMNADKILKMSSEIGSFTNRYVKVILDKHTYQEINYKSCLGIINLSKKVGNIRLEMACKRAISFNAYSYKVIKNILEKNLDQLESKQDINLYIPEHNNIRGIEYYN